MKKILESRRLLLHNFIVVLGAICLGCASGALAGQGHTLMARYTFDSGDAYADSSGNNDELEGSGWGSTSFTLTNAAVEGGQAIYFDSFESLAAYCPSHTYDNWMATFYGGYTVSFWLDTTNVAGLDTDDLGYQDPAIIYDFNFNNNGADSTIIGLTGTKIGFTTIDANSDYDTLHSTNDVTTGQYINVVVTRDQSTGRKNIYINGVLDSSEIGTTNYLDGDNNYASIGGNGYNGTSYTGLLDDVQMYRGVLSSNDVAYLYANVGMTVANANNSQNGLVAHYDFNEGFSQAADLSGNGNNLTTGGNFGGPMLTTNSISGSGAVSFNGGSFLTPPAKLLSTLAGNFSLSVWVETTQNNCCDDEPAYYGEGIVSADVPGLALDLVPVALTGGTIGFNTGGPVTDDTINGTTDINDGSYHHVLVTRSQTTGVKQIFIDGVLSVSDTNTTGELNAPQLLTIGAVADASQSDPTSPTYSGYNGFVGLLDDIQIYSRVVTPAEAAYLHAHPGKNVTNGLVCHYDFDEGTVLAADVSGNGNNMVYAGSLYNAPGPQISEDVESSGTGAISFDGSSYLVPEGTLPSTLASNFSLSIWVETTQSFGSPGALADDGAGVVTAQVADQYYDLIPLALTAGDVAFATDDGNSDNYLLTSGSAVNDGNYHHVVITRDQNLGNKQIYIDGELNASGTDDGSLLNNPQIMILGALSDASDSNPNDVTLNGTNGYAGLMGDLQIYSRVITPSEVTYLYNNPGQTLVTNTMCDSNTPPPESLGTALDQANLTWTTSGDADWFVETTNVYGTNDAAAESGSLQSSQTSVLQTTVTGPSTISFYWETMTSGGGDQFNLQFSIDGNLQKQITGTWPWTPETIGITAGTHTLTWQANGGSSATDSAYVDQVVFTNATAPTITLDPSNHVDSPGYLVELEAAATGVPTPSWLWYKVGDSTPLPGETNDFLIVPGSGTSSVAGSYYAVATNVAGSQTTTTAVVTYVNSTLPGSWTGAWTAPLSDYNPAGNYYTTANDGYYSCAVDSTGTNVFSSGYSTGSNYYGNVQIASASGQYSAIIVKQTIAANNPVQWVVTVTNNGNGDAYAEGLALAPSGGVYATGYYQGTNWMGGTMLKDAGEGTLFLARLDTNGNVLWLKSISNSFPIVNGVASDSFGNVSIAGVYGGTTTVGGSNVTVSGQSSYVAQFNSSGQLNWVEPSSNLIQYLQSGSGRLYVSMANFIDGNTNNSIGGISGNTDRNWTVAALNSTNGNGIWLRGVGEAVGFYYDGVIDDIPEIAVSATNVFVVGTAYGSSAVFGSYTLPVVGGRSQYFARYDTDGNVQLATNSFGSITTQPVAALANSAGEVYVVGNFDSYAVFGSDVLVGQRYATLGAGYFSQAFVAKFDSSGNPIWADEALAFGGGGAPSANDVNFYDVSLGANNVWVSGFGNGPIAFGAIEPTSSSYYVTPGDYVVSFDSGMLGLITDLQPASPVILTNLTLSGGDFHFSFLSSASHTNYVQYTSNLAQPNWQPYSTIIGDGTVKTVSVPANTPAAQFFRVDTQ